MKQLLCYGDSNTWGLIPKTQERYPWDVRWTGRLQEGLRADDVTVLEEGLCGRTTVYEDVFRKYRNGLATLPFILESHKPIDGAILMLGTNDCKSNYNNTAYKIGLGIEQCLDELLKVIPTNHILLISPIYLGDEVWKDQYDPEFSKGSVELSKDLKKEYEKIAAKRKIHFLAASDYVSPSGIDMEHLDENGHKVFAKVVFDAIRTHEII
ncbi:MAG: GDSL-type esterase/lipase family protein [Lachnospiraceae bacterium]